MKKITIASLSLAFLLSACGSQNLLPLEEKSTDLSDKNHDMKLENQQLKNDNAKKQKQVDALKKDSENTSAAKANQKRANYLEISSAYYASVTETINAYQQIDSKVIENKKKKDIAEKLTQIVDDHDAAIDTYESDVQDEEMVKKDKSVKSQDKEVRQLQKEIKSALSQIKKGYTKKDKTLIQKGRQNLANIHVNASENK